jgi:hypothetical protein
LLATEWCGLLDDHTWVFGGVDSVLGQLMNVNLRIAASVLKGLWETQVQMDMGTDVSYNYVTVELSTHADITFLIQSKPMNNHPNSAHV